MGKSWQVKEKVTVVGGVTRTFSKNIKDGTCAGNKKTDRERVEVEGGALTRMTYTLTTHSTGLVLMVFEKTGGGSLEPSSGSGYTFSDPCAWRV